MENQTQTYCLFAGRHELPENLGAICEKFNFETYQAEKSPLWKEAVICPNCEIIVTGKMQKRIINHETLDNNFRHRLLDISYPCNVRSCTHLCGSRDDFNKIQRLIQCQLSTKSQVRKSTAKHQVLRMQ